MPRFFPRVECCANRVALPNDRWRDNLLKGLSPFLIFLFDFQVFVVKGTSGKASLGPSTFAFDPMVKDIMLCLGW